jgi:hypothetical protein
LKKEEAMPLCDKHQREQFETIIDKRKRFNGKPFSHWQREADELVVELILRAALQHTDPTSIIGHIARKRLLEIAQAENPILVKKVLAVRSACLAGFQRIMQNVLDRRSVRRTSWWSS